ncbi:MAG: serine hydrolase domain-containing protein [Fimbriimonadales bacterium]
MRAILRLSAIICTVEIAAASYGQSPLLAFAQQRNRVGFRSSGSPSVGDIDAHVEAVMRKNDVHNASLAIVMGTHLVYAKGYTFGGPNIPSAEPTTLFRQESVSKFVTALAVMQLIEEGKLARETKMQDILHLKQHDGKPPRQPKKFDNITIQDLLEMRSGLDPNILFEDVDAAAVTDSKLPVGHKELKEFAASTKLISDPRRPEPGLLRQHRLHLSRVRRGRAAGKIDPDRRD